MEVIEDEPYDNIIYKYKMWMMNMCDDESEKIELIISIS
jgi:hypothetical protein